MGAALPRTRAKRLWDRVWISQSPALPRAGEALVGSSVELHFAESPTSQSASEAGLEERSRRPPLLPPTDA
jgi:hypothetical protein